MLSTNGSRLRHALGAVTDLPKLVWPIRGGYRLFLPYVADYAWPALQVAAAAHRRTTLRRTRVVAVVGSVGKTTAKRAIDAALGDLAARHTEGNYGVSFADNVLRTRSRDAYGVFEVGIAGPGRMASYAKLLAPHIVIATAVASDHHRSFPTLEHTRAEKVRMVSALRPDGLAVLNGDDPNTRWMATQTTARVVTYGFGEENDVRASDYRLDWPHGSRFTLHMDGQPREMTTRLLGRHQVYSILAAVAVARAEGLPLGAVCERLAALAPSKRRLQPIALPMGATLISDDLKSSIESIRAALDVLAQIRAPRRILALGDILDPPGPARPFYRELGERLVGIADRVILIGSSNHQTLITAAVKAGMAREAFYHVKGHHWEPVVERLRAELRAGDVVLLKSNDSRRLERITLALTGHPVRCQAAYCRVRVSSCAQCPLMQQNGRTLSNRYIRLLARP